MRKEHTFPLLPSYLRSHNCNLRSPKQVSLQAGARPPSEVGARKVVPGSSVVASSSTCRGKHEHRWLDITAVASSCQEIALC